MIRKLFAVLAALSIATSASVAFAAKESEATEKNPSKKISINLAGNYLCLFVEGKKVYEFPVALGSPSTPTIAGKFSIIEKQVNPSWKDPEGKEKDVEPGPMNPLGMRWMRFYGEYGIHGTNAPGLIGSNVSHGCVRMLEEDVETLFEQVEIGTPVELYYQRVVIDKSDDGVFSYAIYPDAYNRQPLDVPDVVNILAKSGITAFTSPEEIAEKLWSSNGEMTIIGKLYPIEVDNKWLSARAIEQEGKVYFPALPLAMVTKLKLDFNREAETLSTKYAVVPAVLWNDVLFVAAENTQALFHLNGTFNDKQVYALTTTEVSPK